MRNSILAAVLTLAAALPLAAQQAGQKVPSADEIHEMERLRFDYGELVPGRDSEQTSPRAANFDESKAGDLVPPPLFASDADKTPEGWARRRAELAQMVEDVWVGRIPEGANELRIVWTKQKVRGRKGKEEGAAP